MAIVTYTMAIVTYTMGYVNNNTIDTTVQTLALSTTLNIIYCV